MMTVYLYVVDDLMIDTGLRHMAREVIEMAGTCKIRKVLLTHHHEDHSGNAAILKDTLLQFLEDIYGSIKRIWEEGCDEKRIFRELGLKEQRFIKWFCFGNVSMKNAVRSAIRSF